VAIEPIEALPDLVDRLAASDWLVFTSANGVDRFFDVLGGAPLPPSLRIAAIGTQTAARLEVHGRSAEVVPSRFIAEDLAEALPEAVVRGKRVMVARAAGARDVLVDRLRERGADVQVVELYRATPPADLPVRLPRLIEAGVDVVTLMSSSAVRHFKDALGARPLPDGIAVACIGPITAATARELGLPVDIIAEEYTARGLFDALARRYGARNAGSRAGMKA
jgi:uroporphyrinogen-III synthase